MPFKESIFCIVILQTFLLKPSCSSCHCGYGSYCGVVKEDENCLCSEISRKLYATPRKVTDGCSDLINYCTEKTCLNGGSCYPTFGSLYCLCQKGYHGNKCHLKIDPPERRYAQQIIAHFDIHEFDLGDGLTFLVIIKEFGDDFSIELDDGNGNIMDTPLLPFEILNPQAICRDIVSKAREADPRLCALLPDEMTNVAKVKLRYPYDRDAPNKVVYNNIEMGRVDMVRLYIKNGELFEYGAEYPIFTPFYTKGRDCILGIELKEWINDQNFTNTLNLGTWSRHLNRLQIQVFTEDSKNPVMYRRSETFIIRAATYSINVDCKYVTSISYFWLLSGRNYENSFKGLPYLKVEGKTLLPGLYTLEVRVDIFGSSTAGETKINAFNWKKCWFEISWEKPVPIINGGKRRVVKQLKKFQLDASPSYDPNFDHNNRLQFTWYCESSQSFCKAVVTKEPIYHMPGLDVGTYEMFLNLSNSIEGLSSAQTSQIIDVIKDPVLEGFELQCLRNCRNTIVSELIHLQLNFLPAGKNVVWTYKIDGGEEKSADPLRETNTPEDIFIIKKDSLSPGSDYTFKAQIDSTYNEVQLITAKLPSKGHCEINPRNGIRGGTLFVVNCSGYGTSTPEENPLRYDIYQKTEGEQGSDYLETFSSYLPVTKDHQFMSENIIIKVSNSFGASVTENINIKLTDDIKMDNLVHNVEYNVRNNEISKAITSICVIAKRLNEVAEKSEIIDFLADNLKRIPIYEITDVNQVSGALRFLLHKSIEEDVTVVGSNTIKTVTSKLKEMSASVKMLIKGSVIADTGYLMEMSRSMIGVLSDVVHCRDKYLNNKSENLEAYQQSYYDYQKSSKNVLEAVDSVTEVLLKQMAPAQKPIQIEDSHISTLLTVDRMERLANLDKIDPSAGGAAYVRFDNNLASSFRGKYVEVQVTEFKENLFWWLETEVSMNSEHLNIKLGVRNGKEDSEIASLEFPLHLYLQVNFNSTERIKGEVQQPDKNADLEEKDLHVKVFKIERKPGTGGKLFLEFEDLGTNELEVIILFDEYPDYNTIRQSGKLINIGDNWYETEILTRLEPDTIIYLGILPSQKHFGGDIVPFKIEIHDHLCRIWYQENWNIGSCEVSSDSTKEVVHCMCKHLSLFGASVFVPPNKIHPIKDIALIITFKDNPYVFLLVICCLFIYCVLLFWAWKMDKKDLLERRVRVLIDNIPGETYGYLIAVFTGEKALSGTTAKVGIKIIGSQGESHAHILNHKKDTLQLGQDNWFLVYCPFHLGDIYYLHVWHDNSGASPDWYCSKIILWDLNTKKKYIFLVNKWLSVTSLEEGGKLEWKLEPASEKESNWQYLARVNFFSGLREMHLWISVFLRHPRTSFNRSQRLTVAMSIFMLSLFTGIMFYGAAQRAAEDDPSFSLTVRDLVVSIQILLITIPISVFASTLFRKSEDPVKTKESPKSKQTLKGSCLRFFQLFRGKSFSGLLTGVLKTTLSLDPLMPVELNEEALPATKSYGMKRRLLTFAWTFNLLIIFGSSFFIILYGLKLGPNKSLTWISITLMKVGQSLFLIQPVKIFFYCFVFTFILKEYGREQTLFSVRFSGIDAALLRVPEYVSKLRELRSKPIYSPLSEMEVKVLAAKRKKVEQKRWSVINLVFITILYISLFFLIRGNDLSYYHTEHLLHMIKTPTTDADYDIDEVYNKSRFFDYAIKTLLPSLHTTKWYNGKDLQIEREETGTQPESRRGWTNDYSSRLLGVPRLRQLRIRKGTCRVSRDFKKYFKKCNGSFSTHTQDKEDYAIKWADLKFDGSDEIWNYTSPEVSETVGMYGASGNYYPGGGYIQNLTKNLEDSATEMIKLKLHKWFDDLTRVVFVEFNLYNAYSNLFSQVTIVVEKLASGVIGTRVYIESAYHQFFLKTLDVPFLIAIIFFSLVLILLVLRTVIRISIEGMRSFLDSHENVFDLLVLFFGFASVIAYLVRIGYFKVISDAYEKTDYESFICLNYPFYQEDLVSILLGILLVITTVRLFQLAKYGRYFNILRDTMKESRAYVISNFILLLFFTSLLSVGCYMTATQHMKMFHILLIPKINFINYPESYRLESNEVFFKIITNYLYLICGIFMTSIFTLFYAKSKFREIHIGSKGDQANHFNYMFNNVIKWLESLIQNDIEFRIQQGIATKMERNEYRRKLFEKAKKKVNKSFRIPEEETDEFLTNFLTMAKLHKKMRRQLDQMLLLADIQKK